MAAGGARTQATILITLTAICFVLGIIYSLVTWLLDMQSGTFYIVSDAVLQTLSLLSGLFILRTPRRALPPLPATARVGSDGGTRAPSRPLTRRGHAPRDARATVLLGRPRRLRPWSDATGTTRKEERMPILPEATNNGDDGYYDEE